MTKIAYAYDGSNRIKSLKKLLGAMIGYCLNNNIIILYRANMLLC